MELSLDIQLRGIVLAVAVGAALGLAYDMLSPLRRGIKRLAWLFDAIYALFAGLSIFSLAMSLPYGRLGMWEAAGAALAFFVYMNILSPRISHILAKLFNFLLNPIKKFIHELRKV